MPAKHGMTRRRGADDQKGTAVDLLGLSRKDEEKLFFELSENESMTVKLLHIFDPHGLELRSMIPVSISGRNKEAVLTLMRNSSFAFKKNGNFFLIFNPFTANHRGWVSVANNPSLRSSCP